MPKKAKAADTLRDSFNELVLAQLCLDEIPPLSARFCEMDGADSLDVVELAMACEEEFGLEVTDDEMARLDVLNDLWKIVTKRATKGRDKAEAAKA